MLIHNCEFDFSTMNANDVDRMVAAQQKQVTRAQTEGSQYNPEGSGYPAWLRFQCRVFMDYLDEVLGEGASEKLGLDGSNFSACLAISKEFAEAMEKEREELVALIQPAEAPQAAPEAPKPIPGHANREQRRAAERTHLTDVNTAMKTLKNDPEAMQQLAAMVLKLYADRNG